MQTGIVTRGNYCTQKMAIFVQVWTPSGNPVNFQAGCGAFSIPTYAAFTAVDTGQNSVTHMWEWGFLTPYAVYYDEFPALYSNSGTNRPGVIGEFNGPAVMDTGDAMGPEGAYPALQAETTFGGSYHNVVHGTTYLYTNGVSTNTCPTLNVVEEGGNADHVGIGSSLGGSCLASGTEIW